MSTIEAPSHTRIEGLGGSFSRNVQMGEDGLGMIYNTPGDVFQLKAVWEDSVRFKDRLLAPGTFEFIFFRDEPDDEVSLNRISSSGEWIQLTLGKNGERRYGVGSIEDLLADEENTKLVIGKPEMGKSVITDVVLKKWGHFTSQNRIYSSKMKRIYDKNKNIPKTMIEKEFEASFKELQDSQLIEAA